MGVELYVRGGRISPAEWDAIQALPKEDLPPLTPEQRQVAQKMRIPEADYARGALASKQGAEKLLDVVERVARLLRKKLQVRAPSLELKRVALDTLKGKYEVEANLNGDTLTFRVDEQLIDELFEAGSEIAEKRLDRVIDLALPTQVS